MKIKNCCILMMLLFVLLMSGCNSNQAEANEVNDLIPIGVEEGIITQEFYNEMVRFYEETETLKWEQREMIILMEDRVTDLSKRKDIENLAEEYSQILDTYSFNATNENEKELATLYYESIKLKIELNTLMDAVLTINDPITYFVLTESDKTIQELDEEIEDLATEFKLNEYKD